MVSSPCLYVLWLFIINCWRPLWAISEVWVLHCLSYLLPLVSSAANAILVLCMSPWPALTVHKAIYLPGFRIREKSLVLLVRRVFIINWIASRRILELREEWWVSFRVFGLSFIKCWSILVGQTSRVNLDKLFPNHFLRLMLLLRKVTEHLLVLFCPYYDWLWRNGSLRRPWSLWYLLTLLVGIIIITIAEASEASIYDRGNRPNTLRFLLFLLVLPEIAHHKTLSTLSSLDEVIGLSFFYGIAVLLNTLFIMVKLVVRFECLSDFYGSIFPFLLLFLLLLGYFDTAIGLFCTDVRSISQWIL